jgi:hypothetical protein
MRITATQIVKNTNLTTTQNIVRRVITVAQLGARGHGVPADGNDGEILAKDGVIPFATKWIPNTGGGGGSTPDATASVKGKLKLAGDLGGTADLPTVPALANKVDKVTGSRLITSAESTLLGNTSGTNTGDNATNTQYSGLATSKQDALGFTPYNATNPSGYQTASQVQTIADAKVVQTITNGVTATAPSEDAVFDALDSKQNTLTDVNFGTFVNSLTNKATLVDADEITSDDSADSSKAKKTSWGNVWALFLKSKTDFFYQPKATVLTNTTASFTTADETKLDKYPSTATNGKILQGNGTNYVEVDAPTGNTPTEQTYAGTITFSTTAPTTILSNVYIWSQLGKVATAQFNFNYNVAANNSSVIFTLPTDMPTPRNVTGYTSANEVICYGNGMFVANTTATATGTRVGLMRRNSTNTGYEFVIQHSTSISMKTISLTISYFTT